jgi:hypothetical protein
VIRPPHTFRAPIPAPESTRQMALCKRRFIYARRRPRSPATTTRSLLTSRNFYCRILRLPNYLASPQSETCCLT